ncbi:MAG: DNA repair protein RecN [Phototrophicales bacterium]|nr:MAG: DNA repair protein RecN [Phototrophicales bacterium]RMG73696.1 MAG: DNA repair protein RecN [Chloroflexota bacterium]
MLEELRIRNFAIIDNLELEFSSGLNVITGETGAGKSIIVDAVELLLGGKADTSMVRAGQEKAIIEGVFAFNKITSSLIIPILEREELITSDDDRQFITLTREVRANGRSSARINGVTVKQEIMKEVGDLLVDIHGQSEHLSLFNPPHHIDLLDRYADLMEIREALRTVTHHLQGVRREIRELMQDKAALQRRAESLKHMVEEIDAAKLKVGEDEELKAERNRLANSEQLARLVTEATMLLSGSDTADDQSPAVDMLMRVSTIMAKLATIDPDLAEAAELAETVSTQAQELALELAGYGDEVEYDPVRLNEIEERLEVINTLKRRYGITIELVLEQAEKARLELDSIENSEERLEELRAKETQMLKQIGDLAANISKVRKTIGEQLSKRVVQELKDLRMERTRFAVALEHTEDPEGCFVNGKRYKFDYTGIDHVEFMMSANPGEPLRPLAKVASGGEAARIMLALKRVLTQADQTPTLIFDEVDQGIGGRIGSVVGEKLWELANTHQVLVVTHLPQLAGYADTHFRVQKTIRGNQTITQVTALNDDERVQELSDMLGATGEGSKQSAIEILNEARAKKQVTS